jgi:hypothetical protein
MAVAESALEIAFLKSFFFIFAQILLCVENVKS